MTAEFGIADSLLSFARLILPGILVLAASFSFKEIDCCPEAGRARSCSCEEWR